MFENLFSDWFVWFQVKGRNKYLSAYVLWVDASAWCPLRTTAFWLHLICVFFKWIYSWFVLLQKFWLRASQLLEIRLFWVPVILVMPSYMFIFWCDLLFKLQTLSWIGFITFGDCSQILTLWISKSHGFFFSFAYILVGSHGIHCVFFILFFWIFLFEDFFCVSKWLCYSGSFSNLHLIFIIVRIPESCLRFSFLFDSSWC